MDDEYGSFVSSDNDNDSIQIQQNLNPNRIAGMIDDDASSMRTSSETESFLLSGSFVKTNEQGRYSDNPTKIDSPTKSKFFKKANQPAVNQYENNSQIRFSEGNNDEGKNKFNEIEEMVESIRKSQRISGVIHETNEEEEQHEEKEQAKDASESKNENIVKENQQIKEENIIFNENSDKKEQNKKQDCFFSNNENEENKDSNNTNHHQIQEFSNEMHELNMSQNNGMENENKEIQIEKKEDNLFGANAEIVEIINTEEKPKEDLEKKIENFNEEIKPNENCPDQNIGLPVESKNFEKDNDLQQKEEKSLLKNEEIIVDSLNTQKCENTNNGEKAYAKNQEEYNNSEEFSKNEQKILVDHIQLNTSNQISEIDKNPEKDIVDQKEFEELKEENISSKKEEIVLFETNEKEKKLENFITNEHHQSNSKISIEERKESSINFLNEEMKKNNSQALIQNCASSSTMESHLKSMKKERHFDSNDEYYHCSTKKYSIEEIKLSEDIEKTNEKTTTKEKEVIASSLYNYI